LRLLFLAPESNTARGDRDLTTLMRYAVASEIPTER
jgi:hypothetical protein